MLIFFAFDLDVVGLDFRRRNDPEETSTVLQLTKRLSPFDGSLEELLNVHCRWTGAAARRVRPHEDLHPMFVLVKDGQPREVFSPTWDGVEEKELAAAFFIRLLRDRSADRYVTITAAWTVDLEPYSETVRKRMMNQINEKGTSAFPDVRRECYFVTAGDHTRTIGATLWVDRDRRGRIRGLNRRVGDPEESVEGRMANLLIS